jgi:hypothetical protein
MKTLRAFSLVVAGAVLGCMAAGPPLTADGPEPEGPLGSPFADVGGGGALGAPLILDRSDMGFGTTVHFDRMPTAAELHDLHLVEYLQHVVVALPAWPAEYAKVEVLNGAPSDVDILVVMPGYPESRAAADAWNYLQARVRVVLLVPGPPERPGVLSDLNAMRQLERVIVQTEAPSRAGFERLQRPLSFRMTMR